MKRLLSLVFMLMFFSAAFSQASGSWLGRIGGRLNFDVVDRIKMQVDPAGNIYLCGNFVDTIDADPGTPVFNLTGTNPYSNGFICKLSNNGNLLWAKELQSPHRAYCYDFRLDRNEALYIIGNYNDSIDLDPGPASHWVSKGTEFICKLDADGNFVRGSHLFTSPMAFAATARCLATDESGNLYISGNFSGIVDFDPGPATYTLDADVEALFLAKYDPLGNIIWVKQARSYTSFISGEALEATNNSIYLEGIYKDSIDLDLSDAVYKIKTGPNKNLDVFVARYDTSGAIKWASSVGSIYNETVYGLDCDMPGNVYCTGTVDGYCDFIFMLDSLGSFRWGKSMGNTGDYHAVTVAAEPQGGVYMTGGFYSFLDLDPGPAIYNVSSNGSQDIYAAKFNTSGDFLCGAKLGGTSSDICYASNLDSRGNFYMAGTFPVSFLAPGNYTLAAGGGQDAFICKLGPCLVAIGEEELQPENKFFSLYPNPSGGKVNVDSFCDGTVSLFSCTGEEIFKSPVRKGLNELNLENVSQGFYSGRISGANKEAQVFKLVIE